MRNRIIAWLGVLALGVAIAPSDVPGLTIPGHDMSPGMEMQMSS